MTVPLPRKTNSAKEDEFLEEIATKYDLSKAHPSKEFHIDLTTKYHYSLLLANGRRSWRELQSLVGKAIAKHWLAIIADRRTPTDPDEIRKLIEKIASIIPEESRTRNKLVEQQVVKENVSGRAEKLITLYSKIPLTFSISQNLVPMRPLSKIGAESVGKLVCFECNISGTEDQQAIVDKLNTEKGGVVHYEKYSKDVDGPIIEELYVDLQYLWLEEIGKEYSRKKHLRKIIAALYDNFVGKFDINQRVRVTGFYKTVDLRGKDEKDVMIEIINIEPLDDEKEITISQDEIKKMSADAHENPEQFLRDIALSYVPHIDENYTPKIGILLACVGSSDLGPYRQHIHLYLPGDPGTGKSDLLKGVKDIRHLAVYVDAPNASARGLTYGQEEWKGHKILKAGLMVKNELVCLDELDKMGDTRQELNTTLEQQMASYHKNPFDIDTQINTSMIAAGNFQNGHWVEGKSLIENLRPIEPELLSRCMIIRVFPSNSARNRITHILDTIAQRESIRPKYTTVQLAGWTAHTRKKNPVISIDSEKTITEFVDFFSGIEQDDDVMLPFGARQEIDIIRLSAAMAKLLDRDSVDELSVRLGIKFIKECMQTLGMRTEVPGVQLSLNDMPIKREDAFMKIVKSLESRSTDGMFTEADLIEEMLKVDEHWKNKDVAHAYWNRYNPNNAKTSQFYEPKAGRYKRV